MNNFKESLVDFSLENLMCFAETFDKKINEPERSSNVKTTGNKREFLEEYNYKLVVSKAGFYYVKCVNDKIPNNKAKPVFENVYTLFSKSSFKHAQSYLSHIDELKRTLSDSDENPMLKDLPYQKCELENEPAKKKKEKKLNVLIICLDSMSNNHYKRVFPKTLEYLENVLENNILFENFNVVGEKTFSNMIPLLTGLLLEPVSEMDYFRHIDSTYHDYLPFIWREFERLGYVTTYNEDMAQLGIFSLVKKGFRYMPTHFYGQPFWMKYFLIKTGPHLCHNRIPTYVTSLNQIKLLVEKLKDESYFSFNFMKYYTQNYLAVPSEFDDGLREMISGFEEKGYLENTMLVLMGDHGNRLTSYFTDTDYGDIEHRNPLLSIRLPRKFWGTEFMRNMRENANKLTTSFDIYKTLKQYYYLNKNRDASLDMSDECRKHFQINYADVRSMRGVSLFEKLTANRTCTDALIPSTFCNCNKVLGKISEQEFSRRTKSNYEIASRFLVDSINNVANVYRKKCKLYELSEILSVKPIIAELVEYYEFKVRLQPNNATFKGNLEFSNGKFRIHGNLIRLSLYRNESSCMTDYKIHGFCYCL